MQCKLEENSVSNRRAGGQLKQAWPVEAGTWPVEGLSRLMEEIRTPARKLSAAPPWTPDRGVQLANDLVCTSRLSLGRCSAAFKDLPVYDIDEVIHNIGKQTEVRSGGQAVVYLCRWKPLPGSTRPPAATEGTYLAFKCLDLLNHGKGSDLDTEAEFEQAQAYALSHRRIELNLLGVLHSTGCGSRVVVPVGIVGFKGEWLTDPVQRQELWWKPTFGYLMPAYERGSVVTLLSDCHRRLPDAAAQRYLNLATLSSELATMLGELHKIHTQPGAGVMIQNLTSNNLLVDNNGPNGMQLLLCDPVMALPINFLAGPDAPRGSVMGTWLWGSMKARSGQFDPKADLHSLCFCFAEMWLVAEGASVPAVELIKQMMSDSCAAKGALFMRRLILETLRTHHNGGPIVTRIKRHLPVSWLGVWMLLLGTRDYKDEVQMQQGLRCLRPEQTEVLELAGLWARIVTAAEDLPEGLTAEQAQEPACQPLVDNMCSMMCRLLELSQLEDEERKDVPLTWMAANFMGQEHPLVEAMRAKGAKGVGVPEVRIRCRGWEEVVRFARQGSGHAGIPAEVGVMMNEHRRNLRWRGMEEQAMCNMKLGMCEMKLGECEQKLGEVWQCLAGALDPQQLQALVPAHLMASLAADAAHKSLLQPAQQPAPAAVSETAAADEAPRALSSDVQGLPISQQGMHAVPAAVHSAAHEPQQRSRGQKRKEPGGEPAQGMR